MAIRRYYKDEIISQRLTETENNIGGWSDTWVNNLSFRGCIKYKNLSAYEKSIHDKNEVESTHRLYCDILDIKKKDRIIHNDITYEVVFVNNVMQMNKHLQIDLKVVE
jgi:hypothetical protein